MVAVLAWVLRVSGRELERVNAGRTEWKRCKESAGLKGQVEDFGESLFSAEKALRTI